MGITEPVDSLTQCAVDQKATVFVDEESFKKLTVPHPPGTLLRIPCESQKRPVCLTLKEGAFQ
jgi:hypothetical protein